MLAACAPHCRWIDVFCERGAFDAEQSRAVLAAGRDAGPRPARARQPARPGPGVRLAVEMGARLRRPLHLPRPTPTSRRSPAATPSPPSCPATDFSTRQPYPDARRVIDAGATVAIATNCNPGSSYTTSMAFCIALAVRDMRMTIEEALLAATARRRPRAAPRRRRPPRARRARRRGGPRRALLHPPRLPPGRAADQPRLHRGRIGLRQLQGVSPRVSRWLTE